MGRVDVKIDGESYGSSTPLSTLIRGYDADIPDEVLAAMVDAEAEIIEPEQRKNASTMLNEKGYSKGLTAQSIKRTAAKRERGYMTAHIGFSGKRSDTGVAATEVAYVNEYGSAKVSARAFIQKAIDAKADEGYDAAEKIFDAWLEKQ